MNSKKAEIIKHLEVLGITITPQKEVKEQFADCFSKMDINGLDGLLSEQYTYDGNSKTYYLNLIKKEFEDFKANNIHYLKPYPGNCNGCKNGCKGYTFLNEKDGFYINMVIEVKYGVITDLIECFDFSTNEEVPNKKEQILIKPYIELNDEEIPF